MKKSLQEKLRDLRYNNGNLKLDQVSNATGISTTALSTYENDELKDIPHSSIVALAKFYHVSTDYLLGLTENEQESNADLRELSIDDDMIKLLKSGDINNRLLCELTTHPAFMKFLADLEIYVDGKADIQIQSLNAIVEDVASITNEGGGAKKNLMDLLLYYFSKEIRMPLDKLTSEEKDMLMSIFERSGRYKAELRNMTKGRKKKR